MSAPEEEPYSTMFGSLKHPIRRKILRMLMEKPRSFSEMLEASGVSSSHLTYHLENLGQLVSKTDDGKYRLSTIGEAAVATMSRIEETPTRPKHFSSLPLRWKTLLVALSIGIVILAVMSYARYQSLERTIADYERLLTQFGYGDQLTPNETLILNQTIFPNNAGENLTPNETLILNQTQLLNPTSPQNTTWPNATIISTGITETCSGFTAYPNGTIVACGPIVIPCHVEKWPNDALVIVPDHD